MNMTLSATDCEYSYITYLIFGSSSKPDEVYATQLDPVSLVSGIEVVTVLFFHAEQHPEYGMRR